MEEYLLFIKDLHKWFKKNDMPLSPHSIGLQDEDMSVMERLEKLVAQPSHPELWFEIQRIYNGEVVARFRFLQEALDYVGYANSRGATVLLRSWNGKSWESKIYYGYEVKDKERL